MREKKFEVGDCLVRRSDSSIIRYVTSSSCDLYSLARENSNDAHVVVYSNFYVEFNFEIHRNNGKAGW